MTKWNAITDYSRVVIMARSAARYGDSPACTPSRCRVGSDARSVAPEWERMSIQSVGIPDRTANRFQANRVARLVAADSGHKPGPSVDSRADIPSHCRRC